MCFHILAFRTLPTFIRAGHWVALAHWPVVVDYVFIDRAIVLAVVTAERTLRAGLTLVSMHTATLEALAAVGTAANGQPTSCLLSSGFRFKCLSSSPNFPVHSQSLF